MIMELTSGAIPTCRRSGLISIPPPIPKTPPNIPASSAIIGKISLFDGPFEERHESCIEFD